MKIRGAALPTVLALITLVLTVGLAMASLSTLSLQFNKSQLDSIKTEYVARSVLSTFLARSQTYTNTHSLNPLDQSPLLMSDLFPEPFTLEQGEYKGSFHFDQNRDGFSSDNLYGDTPRFGWSDTDVPMVPPFCLDLVICVEGPSSTRYFRAILKRVWPYAMYAGGGSVAVISQVDPDTRERRPSIVKGDAFTTWSGGETVAFATQDDIEKGKDYLHEIEEQGGFQPAEPFRRPLHVGTTFKDNRFIDPVILERNPGNVLYRYRIEGGSLVGPHGDNGVFDPNFVDDGNELIGNFYYDVKVEENAVPELAGPPGSNQFSGRVIRRRAPLSPTAEDGFVNAFANITFGPVPDESSFLAGSLPMPVDPSADLQVSGHADNRLRRYLTRTLRLDENDGTHFEIDGSVSNRQVIMAEESERTGFLYVREMNAGLDLDGVTLHVKGDLDLGASQLDDPITIRGSRATLVVDGSLILGNALFEGMDQGFLISAKHVAFAGGGEFYGMILGESMQIFAAQGKTLSVRGGLVTGTDMILRGIDLEHDPKYLKTLNGVGDFNLMSWSELSDR